MTAYEIRISDWSSDVCSSDLLGDGVADRGVGLDGGMGGGLDRGDLGGDIVGGARGLVGEALHLLGDDREAAAGIAGTRGLDRGVQGAVAGLPSRVCDKAEDRFDRFGVDRTSVGSRKEGSV